MEPCLIGFEVLKKDHVLKIFETRKSDIDHGSDWTVVIRRVAGRCLDWWIITMITIESSSVSKAGVDYALNCQRTSVALAASRFEKPLWQSGCWLSTASYLFSTDCGTRNPLERNVPREQLDHPHSCFC